MEVAQKTFNYDDTKKMCMINGKYRFSYFDIIPFFIQSAFGSPLGEIAVVLANG